MKKMTKNNYSARLIPPSQCSRFYSTVDVGMKGGMKIRTCIAVEHESDVRRIRPTKEQWRQYGKTQTFLISDENVHPCENTLCPTNERGERELNSIKCGHLTRLGRRRGVMEAGSCRFDIVKSDRGEKEYDIIEVG